MSEKPKRDKPRGMPILIWVLGALGLAVLACGLFAGGLTYTVVRMTQPAADYSRAFLEALGAEDYPTAYAMLSGSFQEQFDGVDDFEAQMQERRIVPVEVGTFRSRSVRNSEGRFIGPVTMADGALQDVTVFSRYNREQESWEITGFRFD